jgi:hypothetical protein
MEEMLKTVFSICFIPKLYRLGSNLPDQMTETSASCGYDFQSHETGKYGHESNRIQNQEWLCWWGPVAIYPNWVNPTVESCMTDSCETDNYVHESCKTQNKEWLCCLRPASVYLTWPRLLLLLKRKPHFKTHKWSWTEQRYGYVSQQGPVPRMTVLTKPSSKFLLCCWLRTTRQKISLCLRKYDHRSYWPWNQECAGKASSKLSDQTRTIVSSQSPASEDRSRWAQKQ